MENQESKTTDLSFLNSMTGGNKEKMTRYITMFLQNAPPMVLQLDQHLKSEDWSSLKTAAHTLKSQFSYMGVNEAKDLALSIEHHAGEKTNLDQLAAQIDRLKVIFQLACEELKAAVQSF